jgi:hypothetical protein
MVLLLLLGTRLLFRGHGVVRSNCKTRGVVFQITEIQFYNNGQKQMASGGVRKKRHDIVFDGFRCPLKRR